MKKIIIDADPGVDDFIAISLALNTDDIEVLAITTVEGNTTLDNACNNALKAVSINNKDIKVYRGLKNNNLNTSHAEYAHGNNGLGNVDYKNTNLKIEKTNAIDYLINAVNNNINEITILALGPLTNISECIKKDKNFIKNVKEILIMGGSIDIGNITEYAEFNFYKDAIAANNVVTKDFNKMKIFGWNVTVTMPFIEEYEEQFKNSNKEIGKFIYDITRTTAAHDKKLYKGAIISDPLLIAYLIDNSIVGFKKCKINVETEGINKGKCNIEYTDNSNTEIAINADDEKFYNLLIDYLA